jgi:hypothetical protein
MAMTITANTIPLLPYFLLALLLVNNNCPHVVVSAFSPSASMSSKVYCLGVNNLRWPMMGHPAQPCATTIICSRSLPSVLPRRLASSKISSSEHNEIRSKSSNDTNAINDMKSLGEKLIMQAALQCGATEPMLCIKWKADRIVVTVDVTKDDNYVEESDGDIFYGEEEEDDILLMDGDDDGIMLEFLEEGADIMYDGEFDADDNVGDDIIDPQDEFGDDDYESTFDSESNNNRIDLSRIARTINELLAQGGADSLSYTIAKLHEIEVTTPEFDNVLRGQRMFESYKGFDVTMEYWEEEKKKKVKKVKSKSQKDNSNDDDDGDHDGGDKDNVVEKLKLKIAEGKLVGRDYEKEITLINIKGRVAKIRNDMIERVCLPEAKREKGGK